MKTHEICHVETTSFHNELDSKDYPFESGRYWLFTSKVCPFAHRTEIIRTLLHLNKHIGITIAGSVQTAEGWNLEKRYEGADSAETPVMGINRLPEVYSLAAPAYDGRASIPVLFDTRTNTIVNNESAEIIRQLNDIAVRHFDRVTLYPIEKQTLIDNLTKTLAESFIGPLYRAGFAKDQQTYLLNLEQVFAFLNKFEQHLKQSGTYLTGNQLSLADIHAYPHLSRFDAVYHSLYRLNLKFLCDYPQITGYMKRLGKIPAFANTLDIEATKEGYFLSWNQPSNGYFTPAGPIVDPASGIAIRIKQ